MAIPGDTARPGSRCSAPPLCGAERVTFSILIKLAFDELREGCHRRLGIGAGGGESDDRAGCGGKHHQSHDRAAGDFSAVLAHPDIRVIEPGGLDKPSGGARVKPALVADRRNPANSPGRRARLLYRSFVGRPIAHRRASLSSWEATLMYLRPASWAPSTVRSRLSLCRRLASLISIGRLTPAITSILARSMTEMARFDGVPPNMSVSKTAPSPVSTAAIERRMSWRRFSMSSSGPMHTEVICACGPTTCSSAATNSAASRPWVTKTMPIIDFLCWNDRCRSAWRDHGGRAGLNKIAVGQLDPKPGGAELRRQPLGHIDRAVLAASAADGDRQIGLPFLLVARQQRLQQPPQPGEKRRKVRIPLDMRSNRRLAPGQLP